MPDNPTTPDVLALIESARAALAVQAVKERRARNDETAGYLESLVQRSDAILGRRPQEAAVPMPVALNQDYSLSEAVSDVSCLFYCSEWIPGDSRELVSLSIEWAEEFERINKGAEWGQSDTHPDYMEAIEKFFEQKYEAWSAGGLGQGVIANPRYHDSERERRARIPESIVVALRAAQGALNEIPNKRLSGAYRSSYEVASLVDAAVTAAQAITSGTTIIPPPIEGDPSAEYSCVFKSVGNPDHREFFGEGILSATITAYADSPEELGKMVRLYIEEHDLGSGNWQSPLVTNRAGEKIGTICYNGAISPWVKSPARRR